VILRVNSKPSDAGARDVTVVPTANEGPLYYLDWVQKNMDYVTKKPTAPLVISTSRTWVVRV